MIGVSPVGVIVIVPLYRLFGVIVKRDDEIFTVPNDGPVRVYVVAVASGGIVIDVDDGTGFDTFPAASRAQA